MRIRDALLACLLVVAAAEMPAHGQTQLLKCRDATGRVTYSDRGCDTAVDVRQLSVSGYETVVVPPSRSATIGKARRAPRAAAQAARTDPQQPARNASSSQGAAAAQRSVAVADGRVAGDEDSAEGEKLQAIRQDYRRDVNRARTMATRASIFGTQ